MFSLLSKRRFKMDLMSKKHAVLPVICHMSHTIDTFDSHSNYPTSLTQLTKKLSRLASAVCCQTTCPSFLEREKKSTSSLFHMKLPYKNHKTQSENKQLTIHHHSIIACYNPCNIWCTKQSFIDFRRRKRLERHLDICL